MVKSKVEKQSDGTQKQTQGDKADKTQSIVQKNYIVKGLVGKGSYGTVQKVKRIADGLICAMKETTVAHMTQDERDEAVKQIHLLATVRHQNVIKYYDAFVEGDKLYTVMEYCERGDLAKLIRNRAQHFEEAQIWSYFIQILRGLVALHSYQIIHRDIKSANVMLIDSTTVKVGDLGVPKLLKQSMGTTQIGTPHYMAPEVWKNEPYTFSSDMWALGCVLYELAALSIPFRGQTLFDLRAKLLQGEYPPIPTQYSSGLTAVLKQLLNTDPAWRLSSKEVLIHQIVRSHYHLAPPSIRLYVPRRKPVVEVPAPPTRIPKPTLPNSATGLKVRAQSPLRVAGPAPNGLAVTVKRQSGGGSIRISAPRQAKPTGTPGVRPRAILSSPGNDKNPPSGAEIPVTKPTSTKPRILAKPLPSLSPMVNNKRLKRLSLVNTKGACPKDQTAALNRRFKQAYVRTADSLSPDSPELLEGQHEAGLVSSPLSSPSEETSAKLTVSVSPRIAASDLPDGLSVALSPISRQVADPPNDPSVLVASKVLNGSIRSQASSVLESPIVLQPIATKVPSASSAPRAPLSAPRIPSRVPLSAPKAPLTPASKSPVWTPKATKSPVITPKVSTVTPRSALAAPKAPLTTPRAPLTGSKIPTAPGLVPIKTRVLAQNTGKSTSAR